VVDLQGRFGEAETIARADLVRAGGCQCRLSAAKTGAAGWFEEHRSAESGTPGV